MIGEDIRKRNLQAVRKLVYENMIAGEQCRNHGAGGDFERFNDARANHEHDQERQAERNDVLDNPARL